METQRGPFRVVPFDTPVAPPRPGTRHVRVKGVGVLIADDDCRRRVDRLFHTPMIVLAVLTLPLLVIDYLFIKESADDPLFRPTDDWLWWLTISGLTLIWIAFLAEFVVKIIIAECRIEYLRRNWLDLIIICIPLLRPLRVASVYRTTKVFRLRGVGFKLARHVFTLVVGLEATDRLLRRLGLKAPDGRQEPELMTRHQLVDEVRRLRRINDAWETWHVQEQAYLDRHGRSSMCDPAPPNASSSADGPASGAP